MTQPTRSDWNLTFNKQDVLSGEPERLLKVFKNYTRDINHFLDQQGEGIAGQSAFFRPTVFESGTPSNNVTSFNFQLGHYIVTGNMIFITMRIKFGSGHGETGNMAIGNLPFTAHRSRSLTNSNEIDWVFTALNLESGNKFSGTAVLGAEKKTIEAIYNQNGVQQTLNSKAYDLKITGFYRIVNS